MPFFNGMNDRQKNEKDGGRQMQIQNVPEYELIQQETIEDIHSEGYFFKHKIGRAHV